MLHERAGNIQWLLKWVLKKIIITHLTPRHTFTNAYMNLGEDKDNGIYINMVYKSEKGNE